MPQVFYEKLASLAFGFCICLVLLIVTAEMLILYIWIGNPLLFYTYLGIMASLAYFGIKYALRYMDFKESLSQGLLISTANNENKEDDIPDNFADISESLDVSEDKSLKACRYYQRGVSFSQIARNLSMKEAQDAKRALIHGLTALLKEHDTHGKS